MPLYEIEHVLPLSAAQKDALAAAITHIHSHLFTTPSLFVNVRFMDISGQDVYVGGKRKAANRILAHVRPGGGRSPAAFNNLCSQITEAWNRIIINLERPNDATQSLRNRTAEDRELRAVFILGTIVAGAEAGFALPPAGGDKQWLAENAGAFRKLAEGGDEDFAELVREMGMREDLRGEV